MKYLNILIVVGIIYFSNIIVADAAVDNGTLNINLDNKTPLLYNAKSIQIIIVSVENNFENIFWKNEESLPFNRSFSIYPGIYKVYIQKGNSTVIEFNNDTIGYTITSQSKVDIPNIHLAQPFHINYYNSYFKDILSDIPWRINRGEKIPITYIIKDANEFSAEFRNITVYNDGDPIGTEAGDTLVFTHPLGRTFTEYFWYDHDILSPSLFNQQNNSINIHVKFDIASEFDVHNFYTTYVSPYNLPHLENWSYGDTHYHSFYTDNVWEFGAPIRSTKVAGKAIGLDWVTITDHSFDLDQNRWNNLVNDSNYYSAIDFRILPSEEISCTVPSGLFQKYNHYLTYGITEFIPGGEWEDGTGSHYSCDELVSIVNTQGGFGYPAHPTDNPDEFRESWLNYSLNFSGLEIWNGVDNIGKLEAGLNKWKELLLNGRKIFIEAGSDSHGDLNSGLGKVHTVVFTPYISNNGILSALRDGHSIITDGPIVVFDIYNTIIGDTIEVPKGKRINLNIRWNSTFEFGKVSNITVIKGIIGDTETIVQEIYPYSYSGTKQIILTATRDGYFRLMAFTSDGHRIYTNPIWVMLSTPNIVVDHNLKDDPANRTWNTIQKGINNAKVSDVIYVRNGTYHENINIYKTLTLIGEDNTNTIIDGNNKGNVVYVNANNVHISGFKVINGSAYPYAGINLTSSSNNTLSDNNVTKNYYGIYLSSSSNNTLIGNDALNNGYGIFLKSSRKNKLIDTNALNNYLVGIYLYSSDKNKLIGNNASNNEGGIFLKSSSKNTVNGNNALNNSYGIFLKSSSNKNKIYNNIFNNTNNVFFLFESNINTWNTTRRSGINIIGGSFIGGNFWANPKGRGFSQTCADVNGDGICDQSYILNAKNIDYLPINEFYER